MANGKDEPALTYTKGVAGLTGGSDPQLADIAARNAQKASPIVTIGKDSPDAKDEINILTRMNGFGELSSAVTMAFYGLSHRANLNALPANHNSSGYTFFTRPRLNLSYDNISQVRTFTPMLNKSTKSLPRAIRAILDPVGARRGDTLAYPSDLIDDEMPFITILSNNLLSLNGWLDPMVDTFTSKEGMYREEWSIIDGFPRVFKSFELTANFRNIAGDPISKLFYAWSQYAAYVHEGIFDPYPEMILENEVDYDTRIYRIVLNQTRTHVEEIAATGAAFPIVSNIGAHFDFNFDKPVNTELNQISVTFKCMGAEYNDPILIDEFNEVVCMFNIHMRDQYRTAHYVILTQAEVAMFESVGYPRIDPDSMEFQWWVKQRDYKLLMGDKALEERKKQQTSKGLKVT